MAGLTGRAVLEALAKVADDQRALDDHIVHLEIEISRYKHVIEALTDQLRQSGEECDRLRLAQTQAAHTSPSSSGEGE